MLMYGCVYVQYVHVCMCVCVCVHAHTCAYMCEGEFGGGKRGNNSTCSITYSISSVKIKV